MKNVFVGQTDFTERQQSGMRLPQFTTRRLMALVAIVAIARLGP